MHCFENLFEGSEYTCYKLHLQILEQRLLAWLVLCDTSLFSSYETCEREGIVPFLPDSPRQVVCVSRG